MSAVQAFLFPGQGAQTLGMGVDLAGAYPEARAIFDRGREVLGLDVLAVCRDGPREELDSTRISQPAIFLHSMAVLEALAARLGAPTPAVRGVVPAERFPAAGAAAGLSLGEYSALVFAGALSFEDALHLVGRRGEYMQEACDAEKGSMASILGLEAARVEELTDEARSEGLRVGVANYNSPAQTVISGASADVEACMERLQAAGARRAVLLRVAGAYHSPLMAPATRKMEPLLREVRISEPRVAFYSNYTGRQVSDPEEIREGLVLQIENAVRWEPCVRAMTAPAASPRVEGFLEIGPGRVIQGLLRSIDRSFEARSIGSLEALDNPEALPL